MKTQPQKLSRADLFKSVNNFFAFGGGAGLIKFAPGTCGSLVAIPLFVYLIAPWSPYAQAIIIIAAFGLGVRWCGRAAESVGVKDHPGIVWDEIIGMWIALFLIPLSVQSVLLGFVLFRLLDIFKPWPLRLIDRREQDGFGGGLVIMLDDAIAGFGANIVLQFFII